jgi:hypothetical protein
MLLPQLMLKLLLPLMLLLLPMHSVQVQAVS